MRGRRRRTSRAGLITACGVIALIIIGALAGKGSGSESGQAGTRSAAPTRSATAAASHRRRHLRHDPGHAVARARPRARADATSGGLTLVQLPAAGFGPIESQIAHAKRSIEMEIYELADPAIEGDLVAAARRHVDVRVLLDKDYSGGTVNAPAYAYLNAHGVSTRWAPSGYIFHIKATTFDGATADISTGNLEAQYVATSRDATIVDTEPRQVAAIAATFNDDWSAGPSGDPADRTAQAPGLVWSPDTGSGTAQSALVAQIARARTSVDFESEELSDSAIIGALAADAHRGVRCEIVMTSDSEWDSAFATVTKAGCHVHVYPDSDNALYIHEKLILDDAGTGHASMFLGSQNASDYSLTRNRELGIILGAGHGGAAVMRSAATTFASDYAHSSAWQSTQTTHRTHPTPTPAPSYGACHPLSEEGHCYEPGEYCSDADHGMTGVAGDGEKIVCREEHREWFWEPLGG